MSRIELKNISDSFLKSVNLTVDHLECFAIVGPSGAGKTTLLRVIAGLQRHKGEVWIDGRRIEGLPTHLRRIGYVSQDLHLFPHLTVEGNMTLAMDRLQVSREEKLGRAAELLELMKIGKLSKRKPDELSGGEKQRAALARALASSPRILLLDEPFSKLDFRTSLYLRNEFKKLRENLQLTTIVVTHDIREARDLAQRLAVMQSGRLETIASHRDLSYTSGNGGDLFLESENILSCSGNQPAEYGLVEVDLAGFRMYVPSDTDDFSHVSIPAAKVAIQDRPPGGQASNCFTGKIAEIRVFDSRVCLVIAVGEQKLDAELCLEQWNEWNLDTGDTVYGRLRLQDLEARQISEGPDLGS